MRKRQRLSTPNLSRRGTVLVVAIVALMLVMSFMGMLLKTALAQRHVIREQGRDIQADWLAQSAAERAAARLQRDPDYTGETWSLSADDSGLRFPAEMTIRVEPANNDAALRAVHVVALYPANLEQVTGYRSSGIWMVAVPGSNGSPDSQPSP